MPFDSVTHFFKSIFRPSGAAEDGEYYRREGGCHQCGACCQNIFLVRGKQVVQSMDEFAQLQAENPEYRSFVPMAQSEEERERFGVRFQCTHLLPDNRCEIYEQRPLFCKRYPTEAVLLMGGVLAENCGYRFTLKRSFGQVLETVAGEDPGRHQPGLLLR